MKYLRFKLMILWYGIRVNFSLKKELKPKFLLTCFVKLAPDHIYLKSVFIEGSSRASRFSLKTREVLAWKFLREYNF